MIAGVALAGSTVRCGCPTRSARIGHEARGIVDCGGTQVAIDQRVDKAELDSCRGINRRCGQHELDRFLDADQARHALRSARAGDDAERDFRQTESGARQRDAVMAGERYLEPATEHRAVHRGDQRHRQVLETPEERAVGLLLGRPGELGDVGTREERAPGAHEHDRRRTGPRLQRVEDALELVANRAADGVYRRVRDSDDRNPVHVLDGGSRGRRHGAIRRSAAVETAEQTLELLAAAGTKAPDQPRLVCALQLGSALHQPLSGRGQGQCLRAPVIRR